MNHSTALLLLFIVMLTACKKHDTQPNNGCIISPDLTTSPMPQKDLDKVNAFLKINNITTNFVPQRYYQDTNYTYGHYTPTIISYSTVYAGFQIVNKLPVLNGLSYRQDRDNATTYYIYPRIYDNITLDPTPKSTINDIKATYIYLIGRLQMPGENIDNTPYLNKNYQDSCLIIKYGYYDTSASGYYLDPPKIVKAWEISPKSGIPTLRLNDGTLTFIDGKYPDKMHFF